MKRMLEEYGVIVIIVICVLFGTAMASYAASKYFKVGETVVSTTNRKEEEENKTDSSGNTIYKIKYVLGKVGQNSGDGEDYTVNNSNPSSYKAEDGIITLVAPEVSSASGNIWYRFDGWYTSSSYSQKVTKINASTDRINTLYAKWKNIYTVKYDRNGGTSSTSQSGTYEYEQEFQLLSNFFTYKQAGCDITFTGWNTKKDGTGDAYAARETVSNLTEKANGKVTLYAQWAIAEHQYSINYILGKDSAENSSSNPSKYTLSDIKNSGLKLYDASCKGYTFKGWSLNSSGSSILKEIPEYDGTMRDYTLYAIWTPKKYTIKYIGNTNAANPESYTVETDTFALALPTQDNYKCLGWYSDRAKTQQVTQIAKGASGNLTLYAKWAALYTVKYNANKGTGTMEATECVFGIDFTIASNVFNSPVVQGYKNVRFVSWNTKADGSGKTYTAGETARNLASMTGATVVLYAQWDMSPITYTIKLVKAETNNGKTEYVTVKTIKDVEYGQKVTLSCDDTTIKGWCLVPSSTIKYSYGQSVTNLTAKDSATVTLYAVK